MIIFLDTSALYAVLDRDDANHARAKERWAVLLDPDNALVTTNYILVESFALIQNRLGLGALRSFQEDILPLISVEWVDAAAHRAGVGALLAAGRRKLSLVDCVSFEAMRSLGLRTAFTFDPHFVEQGFLSVP